MEYQLDSGTCSLEICMWGIWIILVLTSGFPGSLHWEVCILASHCKNIQFFWGIVLYWWVNNDRHSEGLECLLFHGQKVSCLTLKMKVLPSFDMWVTVYQFTWHNIPQDLNFQQHRCENFRPCVIFISTTNIFVLFLTNYILFLEVPVILIRSFTDS